MVARVTLRRMIFVAAAAVLALVAFDLRDLLNRPRGGWDAGARGPGE